MGCQKCVPIRHNSTQKLRHLRVVVCVMLGWDKRTSCTCVVLSGGQRITYSFKGHLTS